MNRCAWLFALTLLQLPLWQCARHSLRTYDVPKHGKLVLRVPDEWSSRLEPSAAWEGSDAPPHIALVPPPSLRCGVLVTVSPLTHVRPADLQNVQRQAANRIVTKRESLERALEVKELVGGGNSGYFFSYTATAPIDDLKYVTEGAVLVDPLMAHFAVATSAADSACVATSLAILREAAHAE